MHGTIITGASRGLGAALVARWLAAGCRVVAIARDCSALPEHPQLATLDADLADSLLLPLIMERALSALGDCSQLSLINNAGSVQPIALAGQLPDEAVLHAIALNLTAPILLSNAFIAQTGHCTTRRLLNISSGAAVNPYPGWSVYGTTKAGLDHFTRTLVAEQAHAANPVRAVSLYPGVIDTAMQADIRAADPAQFPNLPRFTALKAEGQLTAPADCADAIWQWLNTDTFDQAPVADLRHL